MMHDLRHALRRRGLPRLLSWLILLGLTGCGQSGSQPYWLQFNPTGEGGGPTSADKMDLKLMQAETSPIAGAQARVFPPPADAPPPSATLADFCVTSAGYCPLAARTPAAENCLCAAGGNMYGGKTGVPPQTMTMRRMFMGPVPGAVPP